MENRERLDENGHPKQRKPRAKKADIDRLQAQVEALTSENQRLLIDIGKMSENYLNLVAYKNKLESGAVRLEPTPMSVFVMFAKMLKSFGPTGEDMRKALEDL